MRLPSFTSELSGPTIRERITLPLRRSTVCSPPVKAACPSLRFRAEEAEGALAPAQIRHAHGREQQALEGDRREGDGHPLDDREDVVLAEQLPEGLALLEQPDVRLAERDHVLPDVEHPLGLADVGGREHRHVGAGIAGQEVVDAVARGVHAGGEARPGHRRHRGIGGGQRPEDALLRQLLEVGKPSPRASAWW